MRNKVMTYAANVLKLILGVFFMVSAVAKFVSIENFNIYVFSFGIFSFRMSVIVGWLAIATELLLGAALITGRHPKWVNIAVALMLIAFSMFLAYAYFVHRTDSCHCMGDLMPFDPLHSLLKNAVLILAVLFEWKYAASTWRPRWWLTLPLVVAVQGFIVLAGFNGWIRMNYYDLQYSTTMMACMAVVSVIATFAFADRWWVQVLMALTPYVAVFVLCTAASLMPVEGKIPVNTQVLAQAAGPGGQLESAHVTEGRKVVGFYSKTCQYCRRTSEKLSVIQERHNLPEEAFVTVFPGDTIHGIVGFYDTPYARKFNLQSVDPDMFLQITCGSAPLVVLLEDGKIVETYGSGYLSESKVVEFLSKK